MSDTVSSGVIVSSLGDSSPTFLSLSDALSTAAVSALHVSGGVHTDPSPSGVIFDFHTFSPDLQAPAHSVEPVDPRPSVSGYANLGPDEPRSIIAGALHQIGPTG
jgi:hypothetical protein